MSVTNSQCHLLIVDEVFCSTDCIWGSADCYGSVGFVAGTAYSYLSLRQISDLPDLNPVLSDHTPDELKCSMYY